MAKRMRDMTFLQGGPIRRAESGRGALSLTGAPRPGGNLILVLLAHLPDEAPRLDDIIGV